MNKNHEDEKKFPKRDFFSSFLLPCIRRKLPVADSVGAAMSEIIRRRTVYFIDFLTFDIVIKRRRE